jgi:hypothetical protein
MIRQITKLEQLEDPQHRKELAQKVFDAATRQDENLHVSALFELAAQSLLSTFKDAVFYRTGLMRKAQIVRALKDPLHIVAILTGNSDPWRDNQCRNKYKELCLPTEPEDLLAKIFKTMLEAVFAKIVDEKRPNNPIRVQLSERQPNAVQFEQALISVIHHHLRFDTISTFEKKIFWDKVDETAAAVLVPSFQQTWKDYPKFKPGPGLFGKLLKHGFGN